MPYAQLFQDVVRGGGLAIHRRAEVPALEESDDPRPAEPAQHLRLRGGEEFLATGSHGFFNRRLAFVATLFVVGESVDLADCSVAGVRFAQVGRAAELDVREAGLRGALFPPMALGDAALTHFGVWGPGAENLTDRHPVLLAADGSQIAAGKVSRRGSSGEAMFYAMVESGLRVTDIRLPSRNNIE